MEFQQMADLNITKNFHMEISQALNPDLFTLLADNHLRLIGVPLIGTPQIDPARWLYEEAPFCVVAHNADTDPQFIYANKAAQQCFEYNWFEMTALHSRLSAEHPNRAEREQLLESVRIKGFATGYRGLRIAKSGRRFWIENVTVWNLTDHEGIYRGQAATYSQWKNV